MARRSHKSANRARGYAESRFVPNEEGLRLFDVEVQGVASVAAELIAAAARANAPVRTGAYRDSIHIENREDAVYVVADAPYAIWIEVGTADTPAFAPLRRAVAQTRID